MDIKQEEWEARLGCDLSRVCRLCLKTCENIHPIFESRKDPVSHSLSHKIMSCARVQVFEGDGLPTHVCSSCFSQVDRCYQFKLLCERSDNKLRGSIVNMGSSDTDEVEDSDDVDMSQLMPEVIISEDPPPSSHIQDEWSGVGKETTKGDVYTRIMESVLSRSGGKGEASNSSRLETMPGSARKQPVYLRGLPGFVHTNQEMAKMAVAMALQHRNMEEERRAMEKRRLLETQERQGDTEEMEAAESQSIGLSPHQPKSRRCRNGVKAFKCSQCSKSYSFSSALSRHKAVHNPQLRPHFCTICNKGFTQVEKLMRHQRTHALDSAALLKASMAFDSSLLKRMPPYLVPMSHSSLLAQMTSASHRGEAPVDASPFSESIEMSIRPEDVYLDSDEETDEQVGEKLSAPVPNANGSQLNGQPTNETDSKVAYPPPTGKGKPEFRCNVCLKCFATRGSLDVHSNIHTGVRPFVCNVCQQAFRHKVNLVEHFQRKHSQVRPYQCDICAARFVTKQELLRHYRKHVVE